MAFRIAGSFAVREGIPRAMPVLLEPVMRVEVVAPEEYLGDNIGDLSSRRGQIEGMEVHSKGMQAIRALAPLAEMFGYATRLRSVTQGRGTFTQEFEQYEPVPENVARTFLKGMQA